MSADHPHMFDLFPKTTYETSLAAKHIRVQNHPTAPYLIHNYTESCVWEKGWNEATLACRGLITHKDTGQVLARPFQKFFNADQPEAPTFDLDDEVVVMDKADGSLAILYPLPDGSHAIATRGSFTSDQARWATAFYQRTYAHRFTPNPAWTYLFEIIYPENRVVLDYGDTEDLILLGAVDKTTGVTVHPHVARIGWTGPTVDVFPHGTFRDVLAAPDRANAEGFVVWRPSTDSRIKIKQEDYKRLHRLLTGTTPKHVWETLASGQDPAIVFADAPDEFHGWLRRVIAELRDQHTTIVNEATREYETILTSLPDGWARKDFALAASTAKHRSLVFLLLDGRSITEPVWRLVRPSGDVTVRAVNADAD